MSPFRIVLKYMEKMNVARNQFFMEDMSTFYLMNNELCNTSTIHQSNPGCLNYTLYQNETGKDPSQLFEEATQKVIVGSLRQ